MQVGVVESSTCIGSSRMVGAGRLTMRTLYLLQRCLFSALVIWTCISQKTGCMGSMRVPKEWCNGKDIRRYYQHPTDCSAFVMCRRTRPPLVRQCYFDLVFDDKSQTCNYRRFTTCHLDGLGSQRNKTYTVKERKNSNNYDKNPRLVSVYLRHRSFRKGETDQRGDRSSRTQALTFEEKMTRMLGEMAFILPHIRAHAHVFYSNLSSVAKSHKGHTRPFRYVQSFLGNQPEGHRMSYSAFEQLTLLRDLKSRYNLSKKDMHYVIRRLGRLTQLVKRNKKRVRADMSPAEQLPDDHTCPFSEVADNDCDQDAPYRSYDGSCNNLRHPLWGRAMVPLLREIESDYDDGIGAPRSRGVSGRPLPSARLVSLQILPAEDHSPSMAHTALHMTFGQLLDHDIGRTAMTMIKDKDTGKLVNVECGQSGCETQGPENAACLPITVPPGDPAFSGVKDCLMFVRSQEVLKEDCSIGPRQQLNQVTSYLDGSFIYGSSEAEASELRNTSDPRRGKLGLTPNENVRYKGLLPQKNHVDCRDFTVKRNCFVAGDKRVNEQVALMSIHTIFHRYHNDIEERLHELNPAWDGEQLYQEARHIVNAVWQHIVYNEYLTTTLGPQQIRRFGLGLQREGYYNAYDDEVNVDAGNAFQTAAFRFGHSQISDQFHLADHSYRVTNSLKFSEVFNRPREIYRNHIRGYSAVDGIMLGQLSQPTSESDRFFSDQVTSKLFSEAPPNRPGTDLPSLNMQRGRDHGLPGYLKYREWCGLSVARHFNQLEDIPKVPKKRLQRIYENVADIDLFAGAMCEKTLPGSLVGPTFACMIGRQFRSLRVGDRFWYERYDPLIGFNKAQLSAIRKMTLSRVMCDAMDQVDTIQRYVFLQPFSVALKHYRNTDAGDPYTLATLYKGDKNERRPCSSLPPLDLSLWAASGGGRRDSVWTPRDIPWWAASYSAF